MKLWLVVLALIGCSGKKDKDVAATGSGSAAVAAPAAPDAACVEATGKLKTWLGELATTGPMVVSHPGIELVKLDGAAPTAIPEAPVIALTNTYVVYEGKTLSGVAEVDTKVLAAALAAAPKTGAEMVYLVDAKAPWSAVATVANAARDAGQTRATFVFAAGVPSKVTPPPPSAIDKELDELAKPDPSKPATKLQASDDPSRVTIPDKVFKDCPVKELFAQLAAADGRAARDKVTIEGLPKAIAACNCKVEMASVQRLLWSWYSRDVGPETTILSLELAATGTNVTAKPASAWSDAGKELVAAAKAGKPVALK